MTHATDRLVLKSEQLKLLKRQLIRCKKVNNCEWCDLSECCKEIEIKGYDKLRVKEWDAFLKRVMGCSQYVNGCDTCKDKNLCYSIYEKISGRTTSAGSTLMVEFEGIQGCTNPCVEGYEECLSSALTSRNGIFGLPTLYSNSGVKFEDKPVNAEDI